MGSRFNAIHALSRFRVAIITLCLLSIASVCRADLSNQNASYMLTPEHGAGGLETIQANTSIAIATTVLRPGTTFVAWLDYHLRWVQHVVIYMDDPEERATLDRLCGDRPVTLLEGSQVKPKMTPESRLIERQMENMRHAITYLLERGYTWLLHIDMDELLYGPLVESRAWASDPDVGLVTFTNHEALPVDFETENPFRDCVYFWVNGIDGNANFMAYGNGKSAVRLGPAVEPRGAHSFSGHVGSALAPTGEEAMVLHYPNPSYESWVRKFNHYGRFHDHWFGDRRAPKIMEFMLRSRDVVQNARKTGNWAKAKEFFSGRVLEPEAREEAISQGKIRRYTPFAEPGET
ncbi:hypothetical protein BX600DRAFT_467742 [Xylariales sp. PMI_506]|nr:hypothetical protein BX600DRAFT_467742 [Xylariales sp. PMI_506]